MARKHIPVVVDEYLWLSEQTVNTVREAIALESHDWYRWLADEQHLSFSFRHHDRAITARHERQRNGWYWYAYCKRNGQMHKTYLGRPGELTAARLRHGATVLSTKAALHTHSQKKPVLTNSLHNLILAEKFSVPITNTRLISRLHLLECLTRGAKSKLVLLSASAGYGKTTLLSAWCTNSRLYNPQNACAWISLDINDDDSLTFWAHVLTALNRVQENIAVEPLALLRNAQASTVLNALKMLINKCQILSSDITLILDNYHTIQTPAIQRALAFLLEHLPARLHLVIASRENPPLPLTRLRLQSSLTELSNTDLRFSTEETAQLLTTIMQRPISANECLPLTEYTEGWIAGIQLAAMHVQNSSRFTETLASGLSKNRYILDYLIEDVFLRQASDIQHFLLQTSVLDRFTSSLCDAVREQADSQIQLEKLERLNMFLIPLDQQGQWYRYHHLFAQALRHHLHSNYPAEILNLHRQASIWYEEHDLLTPAVQHATHAHDIDTVQRLQRQQDAVYQSSCMLLASDPDLTRISQPLQTTMSPSEPNLLLEPLTKREHDVLQQLLQGASNREIAQCLIISEGTVKKHVSNICSKLGVQSRTQVVVRSRTSTHSATLI